MPGGRVPACARPRHCCGAVGQPMMCHVWGSRPRTFIPHACSSSLPSSILPSPSALYVYYVHMYASLMCREEENLCNFAVRRRALSAPAAPARQAGQSSSQDEEMVVPLPPLSEQEEPVQLTALCTHTANQRDLSSFSLAHLGSVRPPRLFKSRRKDAEAAPPTQRG